MAIDTTKKVNKITVDGTEMPLGGGIEPTGTIKITTNGTHDVTQYASANVSVSGSPVRIVPTPTLLYISAGSGVAYTLNFSTAPSARIDWGDGTSLTTSSSTTVTHTYSAAGSYIIKITPQPLYKDITTGYAYSTDSKIKFGNGNAMIKKNIFGETSTGTLSRSLHRVVLGSYAYCSPYAFAYCPYLSVDFSSYGFPYVGQSGSGFNTVSYNTSIEMGTFSGSHTQNSGGYAYNDLVLSPNIVKVGALAFANSTYTSVIIKPSYGNNILQLVNVSAFPDTVTKFYVYKEELSAYQTATNWSNFASLMVAY